MKLEHPVFYMCLSIFSQINNKYLYKKSLNINQPCFQICNNPNHCLKMFRKHSVQDKDNLKKVFQLDTDSLITDVKYNHNGTKVAVSDSEGKIFVYQRHQDTFVKAASFQADDAAIWRISWADSRYGQLIGVGSYKKKVAVFQNRNNNWTQIAKHQHHQGSVNHVQWCPAAYGLKLYSAGSDGYVCILSVRQNMWQLIRFPTHESSINYLAIKPIALNEQNTGLQQLYPTIATISKDLCLRVWRHYSQAQYMKLETLNAYQENTYKEVACHKPHCEMTRTILFQPTWTQPEIPTYTIISGSEDGNVKLCTFVNDQLQNQLIIHEGDMPVASLSQSMTGKFIFVGLASHNQERTVFYQQKEKGKYVQVQEQ